jgi:hypothetical protein
MPLYLEKFKGLVISDHKESATEEFVLPLKQHLEDSNGFHLKHMIVHLCHHELLQHEASGATVLLGFPLAIHSADTRHGGIANNPNWLT